MEKQEYPIQDGGLIYYSDFLPEDEQHRLFYELYHHTNWRSDQIKIFGKIHNVPRLQAWYGDPDAEYSYSNIKLKPNAWTPVLSNLKSKVEENTGEVFNSVLLNLYRDGRDSNGWHSDNEKELGPDPTIASITLGQERVFHLKHITKDLKKSIILESGSLLVMTSPTQTYWKHQIPKSKKKMEPRINLTFREIFT